MIALMVVYRKAYGMFEMAGISISHMAAKGGLSKIPPSVRHRVSS